MEKGRSKLTGRWCPVIDSADALCGCHQLVWIEHEFLGGSFVEIDVPFGRFLERDDRYVHCFGDLDFIVKDRLHQLTVVLEHRCLTSLECVAFCPTKT